MFHIFSDFFPFAMFLCKFLLNICNEICGHQQCALLLLNVEPYIATGEDLFLADSYVTQETSPNSQQSLLVI